jgi:hypothetical protein
MKGERGLVKPNLLASRPPREAVEVAYPWIRRVIR